MRSILLGIGLLFLLSQCREAELDPSASSLVGTWQHADNNTIIRFDQSQTYTVQFTPDATFQLSYRLDEEERLVLYDSSTTRTFAFKFISPGALELTSVDLPSYLDIVQRSSVFYRRQ